MVAVWHKVICDQYSDLSRFMGNNKLEKQKSRT